MAARIRPLRDRELTILTVRVVLGKATSRAYLDVAASGRLSGPGDSSRTLGLRVGLSDLVGLTPTLSTLKVLEHIVRTLRHLGLAERYGEATGTPGGGHGGGTTDPRQTVMHFTDSTARVLSAGDHSESYIDVMHRAQTAWTGGPKRTTIKNARPTP